MVNRIFFLAGIHGVGKSSIGRKVETFLPVRHMSSGEIIKKYGEANGPSLTKNVKDADRNQHILLYGLEKEAGNKDILLDGHFVLLDAKGKIKHTPRFFFERIPLVTIVILKDDPCRIAERLYRRDNTRHDCKFLTELQDNEISRGYRISELLGIPVIVLDIGVTPEPENILIRLLKRNFHG